MPRKSCREGHSRQWPTHSCRGLWPNSAADGRGADLDRVHFVDHDPSEVALNQLSSYLEQTPDAKLVVIDPLWTFLQDIDPNNNRAMRVALERLKVIAGHFGVAIITVVHRNKRASGNALHRISGAIGITAVARSVLNVLRDRDDPRRGYLTTLKDNLGGAPGLAFRVTLRSIGTEMQAACLEFEPDPVDAPPDDLATPERNRTRSALDEAVNFLREMLSAGPMLADTINREARELGIPKRTLDRARREIGVATRKDGMNGGWRLSLPE